MSKFTKTLLMVVCMFGATILHSESARADTAYDKLCKIFGGKKCVSETLTCNAISVGAGATQQFKCRFVDPKTGVLGEVTFPKGTDGKTVTEEIAKALGASDTSCTKINVNLNGKPLQKPILPNTGAWNLPVEAKELFAGVSFISDAQAMTPVEPSETFVDTSSDASADSNVDAPADVVEGSTDDFFEGAADSFTIDITICEDDSECPLCESPDFNVMSFESMSFDSLAE